MPQITLHNTKTRRKEPFEPLDPQTVRMYVCGPTVYDRAHIGNARAVVVFDMVFRLLREVYGPEHVIYARNFTDVDDKINDRAAQTGRPIGDITAETMQWYLDDMAALGTLEPDVMPRATAHIPQMVAMTEDLIAKGHAYAREGHVLFRVRSFPDYGAFSGRSVDDMIAGARVEVAPYKEDPMDFVLWKPSNDTQPGWDSPWGRGRPGWHIECSAMSEEILWQAPKSAGRLSDHALNHPHSFDIHGGGNDLIFPHHENEIAQSRCAFPDGDFARYWLHNEMLQVEGKKMSKSLGNFFTVRDLLDQGIPGEVIRFVMLSTHYRKPMDWTEKKRAEAEATLRKWRAMTDGVAAGPVPEAVLAPVAEDLNVPGAVTALHGYAASGDAQNLKSGAAFLGLLTPALGDWAAEPELDAALSALIEGLLTDRAAARKAKDFARSDALRDGFAAAGLVVKDTADGAIWEAGPDFDASKLEALK